MTCSDMEMLVHPYLDGELVAQERAAIEAHVVGCARCRERFGHEASFREQLRARLRPRAGRGGEDPATLALRQRVVYALDRADASGEGPSGQVADRLRHVARLAAPALGALATAAAILLFLNPGWGRLRPDSPLYEEAIAGHRKNLPAEVGGTEAEIGTWLTDKVPVPVRPPELHTIRIASRTFVPRLVGGRVSHLASRDAGQLLYQVGTSSHVSVYVFDPSGWEITATERRVIGGRDVFLAEKAGYAVALYRDHGIGYAVATDLDEDTLLALLQSSLGP